MKDTTKTAKDKTSFWKKPGIQSVLSSLICIILGLFLGFIVLFCISPEGSGEAFAAIIKNYFWYPNPMMVKRAMGNTLVRTAPLIMCALSVLFAYKTGLFNIGAAGQYTLGAAFALLFSIRLGCSWIVCLIMAVLAGALLGALSGTLKAVFNVNEVISCIMLNWISLYCTNMMMLSCKEPTSPYTFPLHTKGKQALLPNLGLGNLFGKNKYITIAVFLSVIMAVLVWIILDKTKFGYELKATGLNKNAAKYAGMNEKKNIIITMAIAGGLAGMGAAFYYQSGIEQWAVSATTLPSMGFNGIAAAFLGGLNPIGTVFASYFIQHITDGGALVDKSVYSPQISEFISSIIIYLCGFVLFIKYLLGKFSARKESKGGND